jgi:hypothetical protein
MQRIIWSDSLCKHHSSVQNLFKNYPIFQNIIQVNEYQLLKDPMKSSRWAKWKYIAYIAFLFDLVLNNSEQVAQFWEVDMPLNIPRL